MPYRRYRKKRTLRKKPVKRYRTRGRLIRSPWGSKFGSLAANKAGIYWFKRTITVDGETGWSPDGTNLYNQNNYVMYSTGPAPTAGNQYVGSFGYYFAVNSLPGVSDFSSLFDAYQICKVVLKIFPQCTVSEASPAGTAYGTMAPIFHYAIDHDGANRPTSSEVGIQTLQQYASYKRRILANGGKPISIVIKPRPQIFANSGGSASGGVELKPRNQWLDWASPSIEHFGLIGCFEAIATDGNQRQYPMRIESTYYFKCKGPR